MVRTKQTRLIRCLLYGYKRAKGLVGNICGLYHKLWTGNIQSELAYYVSHMIKHASDTVLYRDCPGVMKVMKQ